MWNFVAYKKIRWECENLHFFIRRKETNVKKTLIFQQFLLKSKCEKDNLPNDKKLKQDSSENNREKKSYNDKTAKMNQMKMFQKFDFASVFGDSNCEMFIELWARTVKMLKKWKLIH